MPHGVMTDGIHAAAAAPQENPSRRLPARHERQQRFRPHRAILMIALTELFIHDAHEPSMTAASDILWKPACLSRQEAPTLTEGAGTCRPGNGDRNTSASRPENHETMGEKDHAENRKAPRPRSGRVILLNGASSAGKSTLARNLQLLLKEATMIFSMDDYLAMSPGKA